MTVYNGEDYLCDSIESILNQTYGDFEFLIIDDNSTDNSIEIIKNYKDTRIRLIQGKQNKGQTIRLNQGLTLAKGEYIARIDQDDISFHQRFEKQIKYFDSNPDLGLVGTKYICIDENGKSISNNSIQFETNSNAIKWQLLWRQVIGHSTVMYKKKEAKRHGGYSTEYIFAQDYSLWSLISQNNEILQVDEVLMKYRIHENAQSSVIPSDSREKEYLLIRKSNIEKIIDRQISLSDAELIISGSLGMQDIVLEEYKLLQDYQTEIYKKFNLKLKNKNNYVDMDMVRMMLLWQWYELKINKKWNNLIILQILKTVGLKAFKSKQLIAQLFKDSIIEKIVINIKNIND